MRRDGWRNGKRGKRIESGRPRHQRPTEVPEGWTRLNRRPQPAVAFFSSVSVSEVALLFAANPTPPLLRVFIQCNGLCQHCSSELHGPARHSLRDSLSAFVWHFITPLDCRIKHPAKGMPTLAAHPCVLHPPRSRATLLLSLSIRIHRFSSASVKVRASEVRTSRPDRATAFARLFSPRESELDTSKPLPLASVPRYPSRAVPPARAPYPFLCRSMTRSVIQEGKREKGASRRLYGIMAGGRRPTSLSGGDRRLQSTSRYTVSRYTRG